MKRPSPISRSGRFASAAASSVARFTESISFDARLWEQDILGSLAHATMLEKAGLLTKTEREDIERELQVIGQEIADGKFRWKPELEDVHMKIEADRKNSV